jgi:hypothetical protein
MGPNHALRLFVLLNCIRDAGLDLKNEGVIQKWTQNLWPFFELLGVHFRIGVLRSLVLNVQNRKPDSIAIILVITIFCLVGRG